jgi:hypothetical protein
VGDRKRGELHRGTETGSQRNNAEKNVESAGLAELLGRERSYMAGSLKVFLEGSGVLNR